MYTSIVLFALTGFGTAAETVAPSWQTNYAEAKKQGVTDKKPLAVVIGSGQDGWQKLVRGGSLGADQKQLLANSYVCLYADLATEEGKRLAQTLQIGKGVGLVISDHTGNLMAFHHEGDLEAKALTGYLQKYSDPERVVRQTDTNPGSEFRAYYPPAAPAQPAYRPATTGRSC
ncbi:hypothetical protein AYO44_07915 [Planctomycetaceae bacterium SCGC AG-212-F19]|nr:hypothetical protein AYO44_07915 [Planctomycetaceae bacterium SCGC AG-212-F19]